MLNVDKSYVGIVIKLKRKTMGLKQSELAEMVDISEKHLSKIETGKNYPSLDNFLKIAEVLKLSLKDFGADEIDANLSTNKEKLKMLINTASEEQINMYLDMIETINKHIK